MNQERFNRLKSIAMKVMAAPADEQDACLNRLCGEDDDLRREVSSLLATRGAIAGVVETSGDVHSPLSPAGTPDRIGSYRIVKILGQGGMGTVYQAEQTEPIHRKVALKVIRRGFESEALLQRFEVERQALASMHHPNIARVYEAGTTENGLPFFVMEFVTGKTITTYCRDRQLSMQDRLELFIHVCNGVQHAHRNGIIHRDVKPANILIEEEEGRPVPKIIDFGIAKSLDRDTKNILPSTEVGLALGTPEYMSPEQTGASSQNLDTRTDVYSLGVILFELLTDALPFRRTPESDILNDLLEQIRNTDPPRPSSLIKAGTTPATVRRALSSELDWIVLKALEKSADRRYQSPRELAEDLRRHLADEPILASPPSAAYRIRKFVRRHRFGVAAASVVLAALLAGLAGTSYGLVEANRERIIAREEAATAQEISDFLIDLFAISAPGSARGNTVPAREILDRGAVRIQDELQDQPAVQARLMRVMGMVYEKLGLYKEAEALLRESLQVQESIAGNNSPSMMRHLVSLAWLLVRQDQLEESEVLYLQAIELAELQPSVDPVEVGTAWHGLGMVRRGLGDYEGAREAFQNSLAIRQAVLGEGHVDVAWIYYHLGWLHKLTGDYPAAMEAYNLALPIIEEAEGKDGPGVARVLRDMAVVMQDQGRFEEARAPLERAVAIHETVFDDNNPELAQTLEALGILLWRLGDLDGAEKSQTRALDIRVAAFGERHAKVTQSLHNLALVYRRMHRFSDATSMLERVLASHEATYGPDHIQLAPVLTNLGRSYAEANDLNRSRRCYSRAIAIQENHLGPKHPQLAKTLKSYGIAMLLAKRPEEARAPLTKAVKIMRTSLNADHPDLAGALAALGDIAMKDGDLDRVLTYYRESVEIRPVPGSLLRLGSALIDAGLYQEALPVLEEALSKYEQKRPAGHKDILATRELLRSAREGNEATPTPPP